jgi:hypothetical protein
MEQRIVVGVVAADVPAGPIAVVCRQGRRQEVNTIIDLRSRRRKTQKDFVKNERSQR